MSDVTQILDQIESGDAAAADQLLPLVYEELRKLAEAKLAQEKQGQTLQATALVHDAYLRLVEVDKARPWNSRAHFFGAAAEAMRRILVDKARRRNRRKHGAGRQRIALELEDLPAAQEAPIESLDEALNRFAAVDGTACQLVKLRYFAGLTMRDASEMLDIPPRTADRLWAFAKAWLLRELQRESTDRL